MMSVNAQAPKDTVYSGMANPVQTVSTTPAPCNGCPITVFWASRPCGPAVWLAMLLIKATDVETNPPDPHQHCRHPRTLTISHHTHMQHKQQYMHHSHRNNRTHNIGYHDNLTDRPMTTTGLHTPHQHTDRTVKVREISSHCKST